MALLLFLNELSCASDARPEEVNVAMAGFVDLLRHVSEWRSTALWTQNPITDSELARGYTYGQWAGDGRNRDRHRYLLAKRSRAPFRDALPENNEAFDSCECTHGGERAEGLLAAHLCAGLGVSLALAPKWSAGWLELHVSQLVEDGDGELALLQSTHRVRHCATEADAAEHEEWARSTGLLELADPNSLWAARSEYFPDLQFLPRVEKDLNHLNRAWFAAVRQLLADLQASVADWDPARSPFPHWRTPHITPDSESRKKEGLSDFTDLDGVRRSFDLHARMTPGAGRLHFRLVPEDHALRIAYIGLKR